MPYPIQPVTSFSESELWYIYQQLVEINSNTAGGGGGGGLSQTELFEVFNGTNPQGFAVSLFESLSGNKNSLANLLIESKSGSFDTAADLLFFILQKSTDIEINTASTSTTLLSVDNHLSNIDGTTQTIEGYTQNIQNNTSTANTKLTSIDSKLTNVATTTLQTVGNNSLSSIDSKLTNVATTTLQTVGNNSLSSIDSKLTNVATTTLQTVGNNSLSSIDTNTSNIATNSAAINTNTANTTTAVQTSNGYFSVLRTPVILSTSGTSAGINAQIHNIAFANIGAAAGTITVNGTTVSLPVGAVVEYNAGGLNNRFAVNSFGYNGTGTTLLIQYVN